MMNKSRTINGASYSERQIERLYFFIDYIILGACETYGSNGISYLIAYILTVRYSISRTEIS